MSVLKSIIPGSDLGTMGALGKFLELPDIRQSLFAAYAPGTAAGGIRTALDGTQYVRDKSGAGRHAKLIRPANEVDPSFTGYISGTTLTVTAISAGTIKPGNMLVAAGIAANTMITNNGTGTGGVGTYTVGVSQTLFSSGTPGAFTAPVIGTKSMFIDAAHYLELPFTGQDVAAANSEISIMGVLQSATPGSNMAFIADFISSSQPYIMASLPAAGVAKAYEGDGTNSVNNSPAFGNPSPGVKPATFGWTFAPADVLGYFRLTGFGSGSNVSTATKTAGALGGVSKLRLGTSYDTSGGFATPGQFWLALVFNKKLTQAEMDTAFTTLAALATAQGWGTL